MVAIFRRIARLFVLVAIGLALGQATAEAETIRFLSTSDQKKWDARISGTLIKPNGAGPFPVVVMMHGCAGLGRATSQSLRAHAEFFGKLGYASFVVDSFRARGRHGGEVCDSQAELIAAVHYRRADAFNALRVLKKRPDIDGENFFLIGQSNGGNVAMTAAFGEADHRFNAITALYPWCGWIVAKRRVGRSPLLVLTGSADQWTPPGSCVDAKKMKLVISVEYSVHVYPGVHHSFDLPIERLKYSGYMLAGSASATRDARQRIAAFFGKYLTGAAKSRRPLSIREVQLILKQAGYDPGPVDGSWRQEMLIALNVLREKHSLGPVEDLDATSQNLLRSLKN